MFEDELEENDIGPRDLEDLDDLDDSVDLVSGRSRRKITFLNVDTDWLLFLDVLTSFPGYTDLRFCVYLCIVYGHSSFSYRSQFRLAWNFKACEAISKTYRGSRLSPWEEYSLIKKRHCALNESWICWTGGEICRCRLATRFVFPIFNQANFKITTRKTYFRLELFFGKYLNAICMKLIIYAPNVNRVSFRIDRNKNKIYSEGSRTRLTLG